MGREMVGTGGFEPPTSRTPSVRATRLRYVPILDTRWAIAVSLPSFHGEMVVNSLSPAPVEFVSNDGGSGRESRFGGSILHQIGSDFRFKIVRFVTSAAKAAVKVAG